MKAKCKGKKRNYFMNKELKFRTSLWKVTKTPDFDEENLLFLFSFPFIFLPPEILHDRIAL